MLSNITKFNKTLLLVKSSELKASSLSSVCEKGKLASVAPNQTPFDRMRKVDAIEKESLFHYVRFRVTEYHEGSPHPKGFISYII